MNKRWNKWSVIFLPLLFFCATGQANNSLPENQLNKEKVVNGELVWADLYSADVESSIRFYSKTFGWTIKNRGEKSEEYRIFYDGDKPIAGLLARDARRKKTGHAVWIGSIADNDISASLTKTVANGGTIILNAHDFDLYGERAVIADSDGGVLALLKLDESKKQYNNISKKWNWAQLFSIDTKKAADFYQKVLNYSTEVIDESTATYFLLQQNLYVASIVNLPKSFEQRNRWVNFLAVEDFTETLSRAKENGAKVIYEPNSINPLAIISDPDGAFIGLIQAEISDE
jgi:predicted enzyme related to lactoylglutathione lyase